MTPGLDRHSCLDHVHASAFGRATIRALGAAVAILVAFLPAARAGGQGWPSVPELRPFVGTYLPTGQQRALLEHGVALGAQAALEFGRGVHAVAGFSWVPTRQRASATDNRIEMAQFDLGAEWLAARRSSWRVSPLVGAGVGLRAYRNRDTDSPSEANLAGYGALGIELGAGRMAFRVEGRDYVTAFRGLAGGDDTSLRNDAMVVFGVGYHLR